MRQRRNVPRTATHMTVSDEKQYIRLLFCVCVSSTYYRIHFVDNGVLSGSPWPKPKRTGNWMRDYQKLYRASASSSAFLYIFGIWKHVERNKIKDEMTTARRIGLCAPILHLDSSKLVVTANVASNCIQYRFCCKSKMEKLKTNQHNVRVENFAQSMMVDGDICVVDFVFGNDSNRPLFVRHSSRITALAADTERNKSQNFFHMKSASRQQNVQNGGANNDSKYISCGNCRSNWSPFHRYFLCAPQLILHRSME